MTIDEAIEILKNGGYLINREEEQIAEWLEDYKHLKEVSNSFFNFDDAIQIECKKARNKAIDDFVNVCEKQFITMYRQRYVDMRDIKEIAKNIKGKIQ